MSKDPGKKEFRMQLSDRNGAVELVGYEADARRIQNVVFGHGRAGDFELGVDIQSYVGEFADETTKNEIAHKIRQQVGHYCPQVAILELVVELGNVDESNHIRKDSTLIVGFSLGTDTGVPFEFALVASKTVQDKVISTLVL